MNEDEKGTVSLRICIIPVNTQVKSEYGLSYESSCHMGVYVKGEEGG